MVGTAHYNVGIGGINKYDGYMFPKLEYSISWKTHWWNLKMHDI